MENENRLKTYLQIWSVFYTSDLEFDIEHLPSEVLYRMAGSGGIADSSQYETDHLSLCPKCLAEWASWRRAISVVEEIEETREEEHSIMAYGLLKAAATAGPKEPVSLISECGRFTLGVFPQVDDPGKGMITLETSEDEATIFEDRLAVVRDRNGIVLMEGRMRRGRLARRFKNLNDIDLKTWTVIVE